MATIPRFPQELISLGFDIDIARKKQRWKVSDLCSSAGISAPLYRRLVAGNPTVSLGALRAVLDVLGMAEYLARVATPAHDAVGLEAETGRQPKRVQ